MCILHTHVDMRKCCAESYPPTTRRENRFLLEERDLMQEQLQQLAERLPSRQLHLGISTQGSETPFGTPCARGATS